MLQEIKKIEYRINPQGGEVIDIIYRDKTKRKLPVADVQAELDLIDSVIEAHRRRRRLLVKVMGLIEANRGLPEGEQVLDPDILTTP